MSSVKVINLDENDELKRLVERIKELHTVIAQSEDEIKEKKDKLGNQSLDLFHTDVALPTPECNSSHEYHLESGTVRVSFKVPSNGMTQVGKESAIDFVKRVFGAKAEKLFTFAKKVTVTASEKTILNQAGKNPDLFSITLKSGLTPDKLATLVREHSDCFNVSVTNKEKYAATYPLSTKTETSVAPKNGFIDKVSKLEKATLEAARVFLKKLFKDSVTAAVSCGNRSKE